MSNKNKTPKEKYLEACRDTEELDERKERLKDKLLKDEMMDLANENNLEVNQNWTKDKIADKIIEPDVYKSIVGEKVEEKQMEEIESKEEKIRQEVPIKTLEKPVSESFDISSSISNMLQRSGLESYTSLDKMWGDISKTVEDNVKTITENNLDYWENIEDEWMKKAGEFQEQIDSLAEDSATPEQTKELSVMWRNFFNKMSARVGRTIRETRTRQESIMDMIEEYNKEAQDILSGETKTEDIGKMFALWSNMSKDLRKELEETIETVDRGYGDMMNTQERFSDKTREILEELQENQTKQVEDLYETWRSNFDYINDNMLQGFEEYRNAYETIEKEMRDQSTGLTKTMMNIAQGVGENYSKIVEDYMDSVRSSYERAISIPLTPPDKRDEEIKELKKRIEELEEKIEEK